MTNVFDSARWTVVRAKMHIDELNGLIDGFVNENPWTFDVDRQSKPGYCLHKIRFTKPFPELWPCILFDAVNNLRSTLDQCGYATAVASGASRTKFTKFPIGDDLSGLDKDIKGWCKDIPQDISTLFRRFEPYKGGNGSAIWAINKICNAKKHCALMPLEITNKTFTIVGDLPEELRPLPNSRPIWNAEKREVTMLAVPAATNIQINGHFTFSVGIEGIESFEDVPIGRLLGSAFDKARDVLFATEAECSRLGFQLSK
jgi:hypothetical protein